MTGSLVLRGTAPWPCREPAARQRQWLALWLAGVLLIGLGAGLATGVHGLAAADLLASWQDPMGSQVLLRIRLPRTLGAMLIGALLGLGGALAQGLLRNPLADPHLLGSAAGASLAVVALLAGASAGGASLAMASVAWMDRIGLLGAALAGSLCGMLATVVLARGATQTARLLLAGVVVSVVLAAFTQLLCECVPDVLRARHAFMLGSTSFISVRLLAPLGLGLAVLVFWAQRLARVLDVLTLGEASAVSLGVDLPRCRLALVLLLAATTALAVSHAGMISFVGLVAPHLVRRQAPGSYKWLLGASTAMGAALLLAADVLARALIAPQELPVGVLTALMGGLYLLVLLRRHGVQRSGDARHGGGSRWRA